MKRLQDPPTVVFHRDLGDCARLRQACMPLAERADLPLFFQSPNWLEHVADIRCRRARHGWRPCLALVWRGDRLAALWPLCLQREGMCWIARALDDPFGQFAGLHLSDDEEAEDLIGAVLLALRDDGLAAGLMVERVAEDTALHRCLASAGAKVTYSDRSAVLDFRPFDSFESYLKTRTSKTRKNLRNALNRLKRDHDFQHEIVTAGHGDIQGLIDQAFETRLVWMQDRAKTAPAFRDPDFRPLLDGLAAGPVKNDLIGFRLHTGGEPISVQWGFRHAGRYYAFISARNPQFDAYSAGRLHLGMVLQACFEHGIAIVELMAPASDYKMSWTDHTRRIDDFGLPFTAGGHLYLDLWRRHGRSMARRLYHRLPAGLRRHVTERTNPSLRS